MHAQERSPDQTLELRQQAGGADGPTLARAVALARRHAVFLCLLTAGAALRVVTSLAYSPALILGDSNAYLRNAEHLMPFRLRPMGYPVFLRILPIEHGLAWAPAVQHLMGLLIAVVIYVLLLRLGVPRWLGALATVPVLLDAYQLNIEQYVLSETLFDLLLLLGCVALLWRRRPGIAGAGIAGLLFAGVALTRANGAVVIAPALVALIGLQTAAPREGAESTWRSRADAVRARLPAVAALLVAFAVPLAAYAVWFHSLHNSYGITSGGGRFLYARVAPFADCSKFSVPADERVLCPTEPVGSRPARFGSTVAFYLWSSKSPIGRVHPLYKRNRLPGRFAKRVILHQPITYLRSVEHYFVRGFALTRTRHGGEPPVNRWQFQLAYPGFVHAPKLARRYGGTRPKVDRGLARILQGYQRFGFVPGPLLALAIVAGFIAALGVGRARRSRLRSAAFLFAAMGFVVLASAVAVSQFSWRYQLPLLVFLPPAGAIGLTALLRKPSAQVPDAAPEVVASQGRADRPRRPAGAEAFV